MKIKLSDLNERISIRETKITLNEVNEIIKETVDYKDIWAKVSLTNHKLSTPTYFNTENLLAPKNLYKIFVRGSELLPDQKNIEHITWNKKNLYISSTFQQENRFLSFFAVELLEIPTKKIINNNHLNELD